MLRRRVRSARSALLIIVFAASALAGCDTAAEADSPDHDEFGEDGAGWHGEHLDDPFPAPPLIVPALVVPDGPPRPPISGGTLAIEGDLAVVGDPDRDRVHIADLTTGQSRFVDAPGEPGRVVIHAGLAYVALRRGGAVSIIDLVGEAAPERIKTCPSPRGLALDDGAEFGFDGPALHVACVGGMLATLDIARRAEHRRIPVAPDLRDVIVAHGRLYVSRFRAAELIALDRTGTIVGRGAPDGGHDRAGVVAYRTILHPDGRIAMLHQSAQSTRVATREPQGYGRSNGDDFSHCDRAIVTPALTTFDADARVLSTDLIAAAVLAVDLAVGARGMGWIAAPGSAAPGTDRGFLSRVRVESIGERVRCAEHDPLAAARPMVTAVAAHGADMLWFRPEPPALLDTAGEMRVELDGGPVEHSGHALFHMNAGVGIACASCHPEGSEDGHVWTFGDGPRRTQELRGGLAGSAPFHWSQDLPTFRHLMTEVMHRRMGGPHMRAEHADAVLTWIDGQAVETVDPIPSAGIAGRGWSLFNGEAGCGQCHFGPRLTDGQAWDVGTGRVLETPTLLGIGRRDRIMHDGCAYTLADRFDPDCGGDAHGDITGLDRQAIDDLIAYLETL